MMSGRPSSSRASTSYSSRSGGGHNIAGNAVCDDGLMIDLSLMKSVQVNPDARWATVEPGCIRAPTSIAA